ncbi:MAG: hypothetical protein MHM6MM_001113 [Cercozoa sp. M6MM]
MSGIVTFATDVVLWPTVMGAAIARPSLSSALYMAITVLYFAFGRQRGEPNFVVYKRRATEPVPTWTWALLLLVALGTCTAHAVLQTLYALDEMDGPKSKDDVLWQLGYLRVDESNWARVLVPDVAVAVATLLFFALQRRFVPRQYDRLSGVDQQPLMGNVADLKPWQTDLSRWRPSPSFLISVMALFFAAAVLSPHVLSLPFFAVVWPLLILRAAWPDLLTRVSTRRAQFAFAGAFAVFIVAHIVFWMLTQFPFFNQGLSGRQVRLLGVVMLFDDDADRNGEPSRTVPLVAQICVEVLLLAVLLQWRYHMRPPRRRLFGQVCDEDVPTDIVDREETLQSQVRTFVKNTLIEPVTSLVREYGFRAIQVALFVVCFATDSGLSLGLVLLLFVSMYLTQKQFRKIVPLLFMYGAAVALATFLFEMPEVIIGEADKDTKKYELLEKLGLEQRPLAFLHECVVWLPLLIVALHLSLERLLRWGESASELHLLNEAALTLALLDGDSHRVAVFLQRRADLVSALRVTPSGDTALHLALRRRRRACVDLLVKAAEQSPDMRLLDPRAVNSDGDTAMTLALRLGFHAVARRLYRLDRLHYQRTPHACLLWQPHEVAMKRVDTLKKCGVALQEDRVVLAVGDAARQFALDVRKQRLRADDFFVNTGAVDDEFDLDLDDGACVDMLAAGEFSETRGHTWSESVRHAVRGAVAVAKTVAWNHAQKLVLLLLFFAAMDRRDAMHVGYFASFLLFFLIGRHVTLTRRLWPCLLLYCQLVCGTMYLWFVWDPNGQRTDLPQRPPSWQRRLGVDFGRMTLAQFAGLSLAVLCAVFAQMLVFRSRHQAALQQRLQQSHPVYVQLYGVHSDVHVSLEALAWRKDRAASERGRKLASVFWSSVAVLAAAPRHGLSLLLAYAALSLGATVGGVASLLSLGYLVVFAAALAMHRHRHERVLRFAWLLFVCYALAVLLLRYAAQHDAAFDYFASTLSLKGYHCEADNPDRYCAYDDKDWTLEDLGLVRAFPMHHDADGGWSLFEVLVVPMFVAVLLVMRWRHMTPDTPVSDGGVTDPSDGTTDPSDGTTDLSDGASDGTSNAASDGASDSASEARAPSRVSYGQRFLRRVRRRVARVLQLSATHATALAVFAFASARSHLEGLLEVTLVVALYLGAVSRRAFLLKCMASLSSLALLAQYTRQVTPLRAFNNSYLDWCGLRDFASEYSAYESWLLVGTAAALVVTTVATVATRCVTAVVVDPSSNQSDRADHTVGTDDTVSDSDTASSGSDSDTVSDTVDSKHVASTHASINRTHRDRKRRRRVSQFTRYLRYVVRHAAHFFGIELALLTALICAFFRNNALSWLYVGMTGVFILRGRRSLRQLLPTMVVVTGLSLIGQFFVSLRDTPFEYPWHAWASPLEREWLLLDGYKTGDLWWDYFAFLFAIAATGVPRPPEPHELSEEQKRATQRLLLSSTSVSLVLVFVAALWNVDFLSLLYLGLAMWLLFAESSRARWAKVHWCNLLVLVLATVFQLPWIPTPDLVDPDQELFRGAAWSRVIGLNKFFVRSLPRDEQTLRVDPFGPRGVLHTLVIFVVVDLQLRLLQSTSARRAIQQERDDMRNSPVRAVMSTLLANHERRRRQAAQISAKRRILAELRALLHTGDGDKQVVESLGIAKLKFNDRELWPIREEYVRADENARHKRNASAVILQSEDDIARVETAELSVGASNGAASEEYEHWSDKAAHVDVDADGRIVACNDKFAKMVGVTGEAEGGGARKVLLRNMPLTELLPLFNDASGPCELSKSSGSSVKVFLQLRSLQTSLQAPLRRVYVLPQRSLLHRVARSARRWLHARLVDSVDSSLFVRTDNAELQEMVDLARFAEMAPMERDDEAFAAESIAVSARRNVLSSLTVRSIWQWLTLFGRVLRSHTATLVTVFLCMDVLTHPSLLTLLPLVLIACAVVLPCGKGVWRSLQLLLIFVVLVSFLVQLTVVCETSGESLALTPLASCLPAFNLEEAKEMFGLEGEKRQPLAFVRQVSWNNRLGISKAPRGQAFWYFCAWKLLALLALSWHQQSLKRKGKWDAESLHDDYATVHFWHSTKEKESERRRRNAAERLQLRENFLAATQRRQRQQDARMTDAERAEALALLRADDADLRKESKRSLWRRLFPRQLRENFFAISPTDFDGRVLFDVKPGRDWYTALFLIELCAAIVILFGYAAMTAPATNSSTTDALAQSRFSGGMVLFLFLHIAVMVCERWIFLRKSLVGKTLLTVLTFVLFASLSVLSWPARSRRPLSQNGTAQFFFFLKLLYWTVSLWQLRDGYVLFDPHRDRITRGFSTVRNVVFIAYRALPFVFELRTLLDWVAMDTTLDLWETFKLEDVFASIYSVKCGLQGQNPVDDELPRKRGQIQTQVTKYTNGVLVFAALMTLLLGPLLLFSTANPAQHVNPVRSARLQVDIIDLKQSSQVELLRISSATLIREATTAESSLLGRYHSLSGDKPASIQRTQLVQSDESLWTVAPPARAALLNGLRGDAGNGIDESKPRLRWTLAFTREEPVGFETVDTQVEMTQPLSAAQRLALADVIDQAQTHVQDTLLPLRDGSDCDERTALPPAGSTSESAWPLWFRLPAHGEPSLLTAGTPVRCLRLRLQTDAVSRGEYWTLADASTSTGVSFLTVSNEVLSSSLFGLANLDVITLYVTVVLTVGRFLRQMVAEKLHQIVYEDVMNADFIFRLCMGIYLARAQREFLQEEHHFRILIRIYRDPTLLLLLTRRRDGAEEDTRFDDADSASSTAVLSTSAAASAQQHDEDSKSDDE